MNSTNFAGAVSCTTRIVAVSVAVAVSWTGVPIDAGLTLDGVTPRRVTLSGVPCTFQRLPGGFVIGLTMVPSVALMDVLPAKIRNEATTGPPKSERPKN